MPHNVADKSERIYDDRFYMDPTFDFSSFPARKHKTRDTRYLSR